MHALACRGRRRRASKLAPHNRRRLCTSFFFALVARSSTIRACLLAASLHWSARAVALSPPQNSARLPALSLLADFFCRIWFAPALLLVAFSLKFYGLVHFMSLPYACECALAIARRVQRRSFSRRRPTLRARRRQKKKRDARLLFERLGRSPTDQSQLIAYARR